MNRKYSPEQKTDALVLLERNGGNIALTAIQSGISERTLYTWRQKIWLQQSLQQQPSDPPPQLDLPQFEDELEALTHIRRQIRDELLRLATFQDANRFTTPQQRIQFISQLLDRLMKLDEHLKPYRPKPITTLHVVGSEGQEPDGDEPDISGTSPETTGDSEC